MKGEPFLTWLYLLDEAYKNEAEMKMLAQMSVGMKNFAEQYGIAINDPMLIRRYRMYQDSNAAMHQNRRNTHTRNSGRHLIARYLGMILS